MRNFPIFICLCFLLFSTTGSGAIEVYKKNKRTIVIPIQSNSRVKFGADRLVKSLSLIGYDVKIVQSDKVPKGSELIVIGTKGDKLLTGLSTTNSGKQPGKEGFSISYTKDKNLVVEGTDHSGALYGCMELADEIKTKGKLPEDISLIDQPEMVLRGTCIGLQKPEYLPGRDVYEYPYTPETFPWFYDKALWIQYLDMMVENRYNSLYLWNGHPFASLVRLKDYPYAVEVSDETFKKNEEMFKFLTEEADKRGIWVIQMFYNILIPKPFAEKHHMKTQDRNRPIIPLIADYTRKSIAAFVEKYPNVGLLVALGEAMEGVGQDDVDWFTETIIPGVKDGLKAAGIKNEPPIVLRAHDTDAPRVMASALPLYKNLYTENKFNGEALTTYTPRGSWAELHRKLSAIGTVHIANVHILANLEPFRYGSADFIQKSVQAMNKIYGAKGLHLYPQSGYWDWPYTADKISERQLQVDRDWIWYKEWARYAWNSARDRNEEINYWGQELANKYGTDLNGGKAILDAYEASGEISPKLLRRYGITDGNRQTLTLGMLMTQLINPYRYGLFTLMYESEAPEGEMIIEYAEKEWKKQGHIGETPVQVAKEVIAHGKQALAAINKAAPTVTKDTAEFRRLRNDMYCYDAMANFYAEKVKSALWVLRYKYSNDVADLEKALPFLEKSVDYYADLVKLTQNDYLYANSMQTKQRKIPMRGVDKTFIHWKEMLPVFTKELNHFKRSIDSLKSVGLGKANIMEPFKNAVVKLLSGNESYIINKDAGVFIDSVAPIKDVTEKLIGLKGVKLNKAQQIKSGTTLKFSNTTPVKVLVGFFNKKGRSYLAAPELETDASANNYGQSEIKISNALVLDGYPPINVHAYSFEAGTNTLTLGKGACMILGFISESQKMRIYNAGLDGKGKDIDWLFE
ncbi:MAG: hypothetical protein P0Y49_13050 [Candidatus Pedobacter colombiensis]|uniref:Beta-hexosaminidase bacterial type N-terminal domain-containing protein n=1 Tax=Candidatus Pedobacter colombiensis TaxID=3121371 RepID=A0AAJ5W457_9SPHI|nr:hypothetical protein [Pedobacter sp.]WEK17724.1 MAG: hypothetical protein P0Y49_13050 [Pedobacter sp.]